MSDAGDPRHIRSFYRTAEEKMADDLIRRLQVLRGQPLTQEINDLWIAAVDAVIPLESKLQNETDETHRERCLKIVSKAVHGCR